MIHVAYIFILLFLALLFQLFLGSVGIVFPLCSLIIFYLTVVYGWKIILFPAMITGAMLDLLYGRTFCLSLITLPVVVFWAVLWVDKGIPHDIYLQFIPAVISTLIYCLPIFIINGYFFNLGASYLIISLILFILIIFISIFVFIPLVLMLDFLNFKLRINLYRTSQKRLKNKNWKIN